MRRERIEECSMQGRKERKKMGRKEEKEEGSKEGIN
jgi:hypothetical protein